jgi:ankyrin repeat protein
MSANDASTVATLFRNTDYLESRCFTLIHKIILGLSSTDLDLALSDSTEHTDTKDSRGRTAISWTTARGDRTKMTTLLQHNANPNIPDVQGHFPIHYVPNAACASLLLQHGAKMGVLNAEGQTPLYTACRNIRSASLIDFLLSQDPVALDKADFSSQMPLHTAADNGKPLPFVDVSSTQAPTSMRVTTLVIHRFASLPSSVCTACLNVC